MRCKDIDDTSILEFLEKRPGVRCNWYFGGENDVSAAMPPGTPDKVKIAKMRQLMKRGMVDGCPCGCRGDFELTEKGKKYLIEQRLSNV